MWVRSTRKVYVDGAVVRAGADIDLPVATAKLLIGAGKAVAIPAPVQAVKPAKTKPAPVTSVALEEKENA